MSSRALVEALDYLENNPTADEVPAVARRARAELATIREAAKTLDRLHVGDYTGDIRDREHVLKETPDGESTWKHPDVKAWSDASVLLGALAKET